MRSTLGAGYRLGVEAAVAGIAIFGSAIRAHLEGCHGGLGPVVRDIFDDSKTRPTIGAIDEGIEVTAIGWIEELGKAIRANAHVGGYGLKGTRDGF